MSFHHDLLMNEKIVAILRGVDFDKVQPLVATLYDAGVKVIEITLNSDGALEQIGALARIYEGRVLIGAGTVTTADEAKAAIGVGAEFIVSPILSKEVIEVTKASGKLSVPAAFTPTEVFEAERLGADLIKLFPANAVGPSYIKDLQGPFHDVKVMATGGINLDNVADYFTCGTHSVGLGTSLTNKQLIDHCDWDGIRHVVGKYMEEINRGLGQRGC